MWCFFKKWKWKEDDNFERSISASLYSKIISMNTKKMFLYSKLILFDFPKKYTIIYSIIFPVCVCVKL